jgi:DNA processing protein
VQAGEGSGSLLTADAARRLGRLVGAVPGHVTSGLSDGPHRLLAGDACLIRHAADALDALFGDGVRPAATDTRPLPTPEQELLLKAISDGADTLGALVRAGVGGEACMAQLTLLELAGRLRRGPGGRLLVLP